MKKIDLNPIDHVLSVVRTAFDNNVCGTACIGLEEASNRILADDLISDAFVPEFPKSTVDGYAVKFNKKPCQCTLVGKVDMGEALDIELKENTCVYVPTGGVIPKGADTMVMIEDTCMLTPTVVQFNKGADHRAFIIEIGDDMKPGQLVLKKGTRLKPQHIGVLASLGKQRVQVLKKPKICLISTGDELITLDERLSYGQSREINGYTLTAIAEEMGLEVVNRCVLKDDYALIKAEIELALKMADLVVISGGSSVGEKDYTYDLLCETASEGVLISGMAIKPGKPTLVAKHLNKPIIGLPGHPVSAIVVFKLIVGEIMKTWGHEVKKDHKVMVKLTKDIYAAEGRDTYQMMSFEETAEGILAHPTSGKSGMITLLSQSDGYVIIPRSPGVIKKEMVVEGYYLD
ncbi:molybdopterin molybdotransferase MoeA [Fusibacter ferrireducens]|uniref:Molybdopterin molybdenumtransferase n=1 Tax=Fusibacter ferrireducens TaxID=2785058 RepID=A0ABR9ZUI3_9FIRM|nr:molybdopterin molybdotransferase MoeA [Fusibacter ferrireducens]MBF4693540.1 molybdopterin molybdotransferase MoeA [Fusibacter ferrireducens]